MEVIHRSHLARICNAEIAGVAVSAPFLVTNGDGNMSMAVDGHKRIFKLGGKTVTQGSKVLPPLAARRKGTVVDNGDGIISLRLPLPEDVTVPERTELVIVDNGFELRRDPAELARSISRIRNLCGDRPLLMATGIADPSNMAMLVYMGVDVFDDSLAWTMAARGVLLRPEGRISSQAPVEELVKANLVFMSEELELIRTFITRDRLRELVDQRAVSSPTNVVALRIFDKQCWDATESRTPVIGGKFACNTPQSLQRPDVVRHRRRVLDRYKAPVHKRILVLLPCSARKPYFTSRSHRRFIEAIRSGDHFGLVHELILTSPLGLVPRELETFYPCAHYDIPVSGEWTGEEVDMISGMLKEYVIANGYDHVVSHIGDGGLLTGDVEVIDTSMGDPGSDPALRLLDETLRRLSKDYGKVPAMTDRANTMRSMLRYQFGPEGEAVLEGATVVGKYPYWKIMDEKTQLGMHTPDRGMTSLTLDGAARLIDINLNVVSIENFQIKGNIFAIGVKEADPRIRVGDEVAVVREGQLAAVGVAQMSGIEMKAMDRGIAVKVRHKSK